ncbi:MAG: ABC transporter permease [Anaerolineales bacterium]|nr:MAG: ABC transporter permease [Anaerolineales bacterium]
MRSFRKLFLVQLKLYLREPVAFFFSLAYPALLLLLFGYIYGNEPAPEFWGRNFGTVDASVPAYTGIIIGTVALMGIPIDTASSRENGVLRRYRATPLRPAIYLAASVAVYLLVALLGMLILVVTGKLIFDLRIAGAWLNVLAAFLLSALAFFAIGYIIASLAPTARIAQVVGMVIFFPMMFLSGAGMPLQLLPENLRRVSDFLPLSYVVRLIQGLWFGDPWAELWLPSVILFGIFIVGTMIASRLFRWE